jgi:hypothetical protein
MSLASRGTGSNRGITERVQSPNFRRVRQSLALAALCGWLPLSWAHAQQQYMATVILNAPTVSTPLGSGDWMLVVQNGAIKKINAPSVTQLFVTASFIKAFMGGM